MRLPLENIKHYKTLFVCTWDLSHFPPVVYDFFKPRLCTEKTQGFLPAGSTAGGANGRVEGNGLGDSEVEETATRCGYMGVS